MRRSLLSSLCALAATSILLAPAARAEKADRRQPLAFVADSARVDEVKQTNILIGNVEITKGTIVIRADRETSCAVSSAMTTVPPRHTATTPPIHI